LVNGIVSQKKLWLEWWTGWYCKDTPSNDKPDDPVSISEVDAPDAVDVPETFDPAEWYQCPESRMIAEGTARELVHSNNASLIFQVSDDYSC
jgi:hypothetical protein